MERKVIIALLIGAALGAASASALTTSKPDAAVSRAHASWTAEHAAIAHEPAPSEPAATY